MLSGIGTETDAFGVSRIPSYAAQAANSYSAPQNRDALRATWEQGCARCWRTRRPAATTS